MLCDLDNDCALCTTMDDDSCVLKYIEIVPLENNTEQFEDLKPFQVKVCIFCSSVVLALGAVCTCLNSACSSVYRLATFDDFDTFCRSVKFLPFHDGRHRPKILGVIVNQ